MSLVGARSELTDAAIAVLDANWMGDATRPSPRLYPHQWSWDSAFIALGRAQQDPQRAQQELRSLFRGQWSDGMLPHIVFTEGDGSYFPDGEFWQSARSPYAPRAPLTSGIVQPPVHASAALAVYRRSGSDATARRFLEDLLPRLAAWHAYLHRERGDGAGGLVEIWHPWESGMDNSPLWDDALARLTPGSGEVPAYRRVDLTYADADHRPTDVEYDHYVYLVGRFRDAGYLAEVIRRDRPFAVHDVLFNSLLLRAERDLATIARELGAEDRSFERRADALAAAIESGLWSEAQACYLDRDAYTGEHIAVRTGGAYAPLLGGAPTTERASRLVGGLDGFAFDDGHGGLLVPSLDRDDPRFEPSRYWRGPVWPVIQWVVQDGLERYGFADRAARVRAGLIRLAERGGFFEHYDPTTGSPGGGEQFAWTAALVLDVLRIDDEGPSGGER